MDDCSFRLPEHGIVGLVGPNGSGKSTAVEVISGFAVADSGHVLLGSRDITRWTPSRRARAGLTRTFQSARVWNKLTVTENLLVDAPSRPGETLWRGMLLPHATARGEAGILRRAEESLHDVGLWPMRDQLAGELSGGQGRLLEFARIVMPSGGHRGAAGRAAGLSVQPGHGGHDRGADPAAQQHPRRHHPAGRAQPQGRVGAVPARAGHGRRTKIVAQGTVQSLAQSESFADAYLGKRVPKTAQE